jgi:hypothetical protein
VTIWLPTPSIGATGHLVTAHHAVRRGVGRCSASSVLAYGGISQTYERLLKLNAGIKIGQLPGFDALGKLIRLQQKQLYPGILLGAMVGQYLGLVARREVGKCWVLLFARCLVVLQSSATG